MRLSRVLKSITFRYIAIYVATLSLAVFVLISSIYAVFSYGYFRDIRDSIAEELEAVQLIFNGQQLQGVEQYIADQTENSVLLPFAYLLEDPNGIKLAGNLFEAPQERQFGEGWINFETVALYLGEEVDLDFLARDAELPGGYRVVVARSYVEAVEGSKLVFGVLFQTMIATVVLGMVGGYFSAAATLRRVENVNDQMSLIINGDLNQRLPLDAEEGNMRDLASNVNAMLDNIQSLMQGVRTVSDNIAHDLRTPLTRIRNALEQMRDDPQRDQLQNVMDECDELLATFNALLRISRLEAGSIYQGEARVDLKALLQDAVELYEPVAQEKQQSLTLQAVSGECTGDTDLLFQMIANLVDNAVKYTPPGGVIHLRLEPLNDGRQRVTIFDSGPGIPDADRQNVFRRFFRLESSREMQPGIGLGLSLVRAIVRYHGGVVELGDNEPGLTVTITLA